MAFFTWLSSENRKNASSVFFLLSMSFTLPKETRRLKNSDSTFERFMAFATCSAEVSLRFFLPSHTYCKNTGEEKPASFANAPQENPDSAFRSA